MADPDFEVIRRAWAAAGRKDLDAFRAALHPDIRAIPFGAAMEGKSYQGVDELAGWLRDEIWESWETFDTVPEEFCRVGESILVRGHWRATGKGSGVDLDILAMWVVRLRDGKTTTWRSRRSGWIAGHVRMGPKSNAATQACRSRRCRTRTLSWSAAPLRRSRLKGSKRPAVLRSRLRLAYD